MISFPLRRQTLTGIRTSAAGRTHSPAAGSSTNTTTFTRPISVSGPRHSSTVTSQQQPSSGYGRPAKLHSAAPATVLPLSRSAGSGRPTGGAVPTNKRSPGLVTAAATTTTRRSPNVGRENGAAKTVDRRGQGPSNANPR